MEVASTGSVRFDDVRFCWPGEGPLLDSFSYEAAAGRITALVGPSGSGKSSLLRLAAGLLPPLAGAVHADGDRAFVFQAPTPPRWPNPGSWPVRAMTQDLAT